MIDAIYGSPRIRAWPRERGPSRNLTNVQWTNWLKGVTFLYRYQPAKFQAQLQTATKGTPWMARDPFISGFRGRAWSFTDQNGRTYYPVVARQAVSQSLDAIAQLQGNMLVRGPNGWLAIDPPSSVGDVLTIADLADPPQWQPGGGGGGELDIWSPDSAPATPGSEDDEFLVPNAGVPAGWTLWDNPGNGSVDVDEAGLVMQQPTAAGAQNYGIVKAIPAGDFTIWTKQALLGRRASTLWGGLAIFADPSTATADLNTYGLTFNVSGAAVNASRWNQWNTHGTTVLALSNINTAPTSMYLRLRRTGTTYEFDISTDGLSWARVLSHTPTFTPSHFGLILGNQATGADAAMRYAFFRYLDSDVGAHALAHGHRLG